MIPIYETLGGLNYTVNKNANSADSIYFKALIADHACKFGVASCISDALRMFKHWMNDDGEKNM